jgi:hypothetical protein
MIQSQYILDIFDLSFDDHKASNLLRKQVEFLTVSETEHTGIGLFISFSANSDILNYKAIRELSVNEKANNEIFEMVDGVEIKNDAQSILADAIVHLKEGIIDCLEIWNKNGENYPLIEPEHYELTQNWLGDRDSRIIIR